MTALGHVRAGVQVSRIWRAAAFAIVGATGLVVNSAALVLATSAIGLHYVMATAVATQVSTIWNFGLTERFVFERAAPRHGPLGRLVRFAAVNNLTLLARAPFVVFLTEWVGLHYAMSNLVTLAASFALRFVVADRLIWSGASDAGEPDAPAAVLALEGASVAP